MNTLSKVLVTAYGINVIGFAMTLMVLCVRDGMHQKVPDWFTIWGLWGFLMPIFLTASAFGLYEITKLWKP